MSGGVDRNKQRTVTTTKKSRPATQLGKVSFVNRDIRAVLFDLDGTLADTLADLANATNWALAKLGCPTHPVESYRLRVGDGTRELCARALPPDKQSLVDEAVRLMR